jgi:O-antigen/teichoic acid export membrane protein
MLERYRVSTENLLRKLLSGHLARSTIKTTAVFGMRLAAQATTLIFLARLLGPAQFGEFSSIAALAVLMGTLSTLGTHLVLLGETAIKPSNRDTILPFAIPTTLVCGTTLFALYSLSVIHFIQPNLVTWTVVSAIGITELVVQPLIYLACGELQGLDQSPLSQTLLNIPLFFRAGLLGLMTIGQMGNVLQAYAISYLIISTLTIVFIQHCLPAKWPSPQNWRLPKTHEIQKAVGYSFLSLSSSGTSEVDKTLSPVLIGTTNAGLYIIGTRILSAMALPIGALAISAMPRIFRSHEANTGLGSLQKRMFIASLLYGTVVGVALWLCASFFVRILGPHYQNLPDTLSWIAFACPALCFRYISGTLLVGINRPWLRSGGEFMGIAIFILSAPLLTSMLGYQGFLLALVLSEWCMAVATGLILAKCKSQSTSIS